MAPLYPPRDAALRDYQADLRWLPTRLLREQQEGYGWQLAEIETEFGVAWREESTNFVRFKLDEIERELERRRELKARATSAPDWPAPPSSDREMWDRVKQTFNLQGVIEQLGYVHFRRAGKDLVCSCPFPWHDDSTPSFHLYPDHWFCYGCGIGGSVIDFVAAFHGIPPKEAVNMLAQEAGLTTPPVSRGSVKRASKQRIIRRDGRTITSG